MQWSIIRNYIFNVLNHCQYCLKIQSVTVLHAVNSSLFEV